MDKSERERRERLLDENSRRRDALLIEMAERAERRALYGDDVVEWQLPPQGPVREEKPMTQQIRRFTAEEQQRWDSWLREGIARNNAMVAAALSKVRAADRDELERALRSEFAQFDAGIGALQSQLDQLRDELAALRDELDQLRDEQMRSLTNVTTLKARL